MDGVSPETCAECGFDSQRWRVYDAGTLFEALGYWWRLATTALEGRDLNRRPAPKVWSVLEYGLHTALVTAVLRTGIEAILAENGVALPAPPADPGVSAESPDLDASGVVADLEREGHLLAAVTRQRGASWANVGHLPDGAVIQAEAALAHAAHDTTHHFMDAGRGLAAVSSGTPRAEGSVVQINVSAGGVPKSPILEGEVGWQGLAEDHQGDHKHHGRPFQALCLWSTEVIDEFASSGHPIAPGSAGENLTLAGVEWASLRPGARVQAGEALLELSFPAVPCQKQALWFADGDFSRISYERSPQWARWYAWVRRPGQVRSGDPVIVQP